MLDDSELSAILSSQISHSSLGTQSEDDEDAADALDYYLGRPYGDEKSGSSQVVTRQVMESVERSLAGLLRVFGAGEKVVQFDPTGAEDQKQAEQETDYVNYVFNKQNNGFVILHDWFKDALLQKNGYVKVWVEELDNSHTETYSDLDELALADVLNDADEIEALEQETREETIETDLGPIVVTMYDVKVKVIDKSKVIRVAVVPQEEIGVSEDWNKLSLMECPFVYHKVTKTASQWISEGYDKEIINNLSDTNEGTAEDQIKVARFETRTILHNEVDESTREITAYECYLRIDADEDGISELRKITKVGGTILDNEEIDFIPFATLSPKPVPHRHVGISDAELVMPYQRISSVLWRQMLNNLYRTNQPNRGYVDKNVNPEDLGSHEIGQQIRCKNQGDIWNLDVPFTAGASFPMLETIDIAIEGLTGQSRANSGLDPNILAKSTASAFLAGLDQASQLTEKTARIFAETGVKELFKMIHELSIKHIDKETVIQLRNEYVPIKPTEWKKRANMSVVVGLGTGSKDREMAQLLALAEKQEQHILQGSPIFNLQNLYNTYQRIIERGDLGKDSTPFITNPDDAEPEQTQADPNSEFQAELLRIEKEKNQLESQRNQMKIEELKAKFQADIQKEQDRNQQFLLKLEEDQRQHDEAMFAKLAELELRFDQDIPNDTR